MGEIDWLDLSDTDEELIFATPTHALTVEPHEWGMAIIQRYKPGLRGYEVDILEIEHDDWAKLKAAWKAYHDG